MAGYILETYVISEVIKSYQNKGRTPRLYFYRDKDMHEIDLIIEENGILHPVEIKKTATIKNIDTKNFGVLQKLKVPIGASSVLCFVQSFMPIANEINTIPIGYI